MRIREKLRKVIIGKCKAEGLDIFTDDWYKIENALSKTVAPQLCIKIAKIIRKQKPLPCRLT